MTKRVRAIQIRPSESGSESGSDGSDSDGDNHRLALRPSRRLRRRWNMVRIKKIKHQLIINLWINYSQITDPGSKVVDRNGAAARTVDLESTLIWDVGDVSPVISAVSEDIRQITAFSYAVGVEISMIWCPMEEFYNQIRQWYNPAKHAGMLPESAEKMTLTDQDSRNPDLRGAEVSIVDTTFARKGGCYIDTSQIQDC
ncbi:LOW QUALITY PROTEIN: Hypothetical protein PHPALM_13692, partial [Phytophthora palmivora]